MAQNDLQAWMRTHNVLTGVVLIALGAFVAVMGASSDSGLALVFGIVFVAAGAFIAVAGRRLPGWR